VTFQLDVSVADLGLSQPGVYVIAIEVLATHPDGSRGVVGKTTTVLPYVPNLDDVGRVGVAWVWPLTWPMQRAPEGTLPDDEFGEALEPSGALGAAILGADGTPVTWLVDPAVVEAAAALASPPTGEAPTPHQAAAADFLEALRQAASHGEVALLPYADVDAVALNRTGLADDLQLALASRTIAADLLPGAREDLGYAPGGMTDTPTANVLAEAGVRRLLVANAGLDTPSRADAPRARIEVGGRTIDAVRVQDPAADGADEGVHGRQLLLAQSALAATGADAETEPLVLIPPPELSAETARGLLDTASSAPWTSPIPLTDVMRAPAVTGELAYPAAAKDAEVPADYLAAVSALKERIGVLRELTGGADSPAAGPSRDDGLDLAVLRLESAAWRTDLATARGAVAALRHDLDTQIGSVHIASTGTVTLSSSRGRFPLTVQNELAEPVTIEVELRPRNPARLRMSDVPPVSIPAGQLATVNVEAQAGSNGTFLVDVRLKTASGAIVGAPLTLTLRATEYDTVAWIVIVVAAGLLFLASATRIVRRVLRARAR
jgi:hypothetical protein